MQRHLRFEPDVANALMVEGERPTRQLNRIKSVCVMLVMFWALASVMIWSACPSIVMRMSAPRSVNATREAKSSIVMLKALMSSAYYDRPFPGAVVLRCCDRAERAAGDQTSGDFFAL